MRIVFDGRSRRTSRGSRRARVKSPGKRLSLASSLQRAKRRKSVGSLVLVAKPTSGGGLAFEVPVRKRGAEQAFVDGRRLDLTRPGVLDGTPITRGQETRASASYQGVRGIAANLSRGRQRRAARGSEPRVSRSDTRSGSVVSRLASDSVKFGRHLQSVCTAAPKLIGRRQTLHDPSLRLQAMPGARRAA